MNPRKTSMRLQPNLPLRISHGKGMVITGHAGLAWLTLPGHSDDIFLGPGDAFAIERRGLIIIEAIEPAHLVLQHNMHWPAKLMAGMSRLRDVFRAALRTPS
jgi:hypothetical protein